MRRFKFVRLIDSCTFSPVVNIYQIINDPIGRYIGTFGRYANSIGINDSTLQGIDLYLESCGEPKLSNDEIILIKLTGDN